MDAATSPSLLNAPEVMHVACGADQRYAPYCAAMLHSLFEHSAGMHVHVHYLCAPEFPLETQEALRRLARRHGADISFYAISDDKVDGLPPMRGIRRLVWYRVFLPELLPAIDRILYLDADTLVVRPIAELWNMDISGYPFAAVENVIEPGLREKQLSALELPASAAYFNSGVMLMNLAVMRASQMTQKVLAYARRAHDRLIWGDQDALNALLCTRYVELHPRWNCQNSLYYWPAARRLFGDRVVDDAIRTAGILHFEGPEEGKPWHYLSTHPFRRTYLRHLHATGLPVPPLQGRTPRNILYKLTPARLRKLAFPVNGARRLSLLKQALKGRLRRALRGRGYDVVRLPPPDQRYAGHSYDTRIPLPPGAAEALRADNPRLLELRERNERLDLPMAARSLWSAQYLSTELDLTRFRGDNVYVWQFRNVREEARRKYYLYLRDIASRDSHDLLARLDEDGQFGCWTFDYPGWPTVSRELLDSINELYFLQRHLGFLDHSGWSVLDIGAGYGRLAHRSLAASPGLGRYVCTDAVPESTFLCEYYLSFRRCQDRAEVWPLYELDERLASSRFDLALNIHSFSEMSLRAIRGWISRVAARRVPWLFIVPNDGERLLSMEDDGLRRNFEPVLADHGYERFACEPVFSDPTLRALIGVEDHFFLFRLREDGSGP